MPSGFSFEIVRKSRRYGFTNSHLDSRIPHASELTTLAQKSSRTAIMRRSITMAGKSSKKSGKGRTKIGSLKRGKSEVGKKGLKKIRGGSPHNYSSISYRDTLKVIQTSFSE